MCLSVRHTKRNLEFFKADREAEYKQLQMRPEHDNLALIAIRDPGTSLCMASHPESLLFGAASAALHYNCFSRLLAVLFNRAFGIPLI